MDMLFDSQETPDETSIHDGSPSALQLYDEEVTKLKVTHAELERLAVSGDRDALVHALLPVVRKQTSHIVRKHRLRGDLEDLVQAANVAMLQAIDSWDEDGGASITTWVYWYAQREIFRENTRISHPLLIPLGNGDDEDEPGDHVEIDDSWSPDVIGGDLFDASRLWASIGGLDGDEQQVLIETYVFGKSLREVSSSMNISHTEVARLLKQAVEVLRSLYIYT